MLSFEVKSPRDPGRPDELSITVDAEGLGALMAQLRFLKEGRTEHVHLFSEEWGGTHLDSQPQAPTNVVIHHVKILLREGREKDSAPPGSATPGPGPDRRLEGDRDPSSFGPGRVSRFRLSLSGGLHPNEAGRTAMNETKIAQGVDLLSRLQEWYLAECNEDWEHSFGVKIDTLDNPGWMVTIDLAETRWSDLHQPRRVVTRGERDWVQTEVVESQFMGCGGPCNLEEILTLFFGIIEDPS